MAFSIQTLDQVLPLLKELFTVLSLNSNKIWSLHLGLLDFRPLPQWPCSSRWAFASSVVSPGMSFPLSFNTSPVLFSVPVLMLSPPQRGLPWPHHRTQTKDGWLMMMSEPLFLSCHQHCWMYRENKSSACQRVCFFLFLFGYRTIYTSWNDQEALDGELEKWILVLFGEP